MRRALPLAFLCATAVLPGLAGAQDNAQTEADRGWLTGFLEDNLSGSGREVRLEGFAGAFSSRATFTSLTVADDEGVWLTIRNGAIQWNRSALLAGRIEIQELSAAEIDLPRAPGTDAEGNPQTELPAPEAPGFALPELPVSLRVDQLRADKVVLGEALFGTAAEVGVSGNASLAGGEGSAKLELKRLDGPAAQVSLTAAYANATQRGTIDLLVSEARDGIAAQLMGLPGAPALTFALHGDGTPDDFMADLVLTTDGQPRLNGKLALMAEAAAPGSPPTRHFRADVTGNVAPLFLPAYQEFFGPSVHLTAEGSRTPEGAMSLSEFTMAAQALAVTGRMDIGADGQPALADLTAHVGLPPAGDGGSEGTENAATRPEVLLPGSGTPTWLQSADLTLRFDAAEGPDWQVTGSIAGFRQAALSIATLTLDGQGRLTPAGTAGPGAFAGAFDFAAEGVAAPDPALAGAIGPALRGRAEFDWQEGGALSIPALRLTGEGYGLEAQARIDGLDSAFTLSGTATARIDDAGRFSGLAERPLSGRAEARIEGSAGLLSGIFDLQAEVAGTDLGIGQPEVDRLLAGRSTIAASVARDTTGTRLRSFALRATTLSADASGQLATGASDVTAELDFGDLSVLGGPYRGRLAATARLTETAAGTGALRRLVLDGTGTGLAIGQPEADRLLAGTTALSITAEQEGEAVRLVSARIGNDYLSLTGGGSYRPGDSAFDLRFAFPDLSVMGGGWRGALDAQAHLTETGDLRQITLDGTGRNLGLGMAEADRVLAGETTLALAASQEGDRIRIERLSLQNPQLQAEASGQQSETGARSLDLSARLADMALVVPGFPGALSVRGRAEEVAAGYALDLTLEGPGGTRATVNGTTAGDFATADLAIRGSAQAGLANAFLDPQNVEGPLSFDLRLNGAPGLAALSGRVGLNGGRFSAPSAGIALRNLQVTADLSGGRAQLSASARMDAGGGIAVSGPVTLSAPYNADLRVEFQRAALRDPQLYETRVNGALGITGPLAGGARIAGALSLEATEIRVPNASLGGTSAIPDMRHVAEPAAVRATRARAGLLGAEGGSGGGGRARPYVLDVTVDAPQQIFVRGRGLDAELGGALRVQGTTDNVIPQGRFELIRGRLDILGKRFTLDEGLIELQGSLVPTIRFSASTDSDGDTATIVIEGPASEPEIHFVSASGLPEEEVLARLLFGHGLESISPLQAAQLASAVATLAGRGGEGIVGRLRQNFGLDDFDVTTDAEGNAAVRAGKYLSENVYTDVTVDAGGDTSISLNLDVTKNVTVKGSVDAEGGTGIGVFFEKDY